MSRSDSKEIGSQIESILCERHGWEHVDGDLEDPDAIDQSGQPIEIKAAALEISDGSAMRSGRFYLRQRAHEELLEQRGSYALAVYEERDGDLEILSTTICPARIVDSVVGSWSRVDRIGERAIAKIAHSRVTEIPEGSA